MQKNNSLNEIETMIIEETERLLSEKENILIAIDGRCGSGKTTLAVQLQKKLQCEVIPMDDFFLRPEQRTEERLATPGGNVDYERFLKEVMVPLSAGRDFSYRPYDCRTQTLKGDKKICRNRITIIEGAYSCHPKLWEYYDLHIFLDVDKITQMDRIRKRNGNLEAVLFVEKWIPLEEKYFMAYGIQERCKN